MNFSIVGTNFISDNFIDALASVPECRAVAVYSRTDERGRYFANKHGIAKVYTSYADMLADSEIDAVYIASPIYAHAEQAIAAMEHGKHVLCEKMIAHSHEAFLEMRNTAKHCGVTLLEAMRQDFDPALELIRASLSRLGKIRRASLEFCQYSRRYDSFLSGTVLNAFNPELKNSAISDIGIYPLHTAVILFGEPKRAHGSSVYLHNGFEGAGSVILEYEDMIATVSYSKIGQSVTPSVIEGELGSLTIDKISSPSEIVLRLRGEEPMTIPYSAVENNMIYEIAAFADMCSRKRSAEEYLDASGISVAIADCVLGKRDYTASCNKNECR